MKPVVELGHPHPRRRRAYARVGLVLARSPSMLVLIVFATAALFVWADLIATDWRDLSGPAWAGPSKAHWLGTNQIGQDVLARTLQSLASAFEIGLLVALGAATLGLAIGALAGYYHGRWIDEGLLWLMGCFESIPYYLMMGAVLFALGGAAGALQLAMVLSFWPAVARVVRIRVVSLRSEGFILAARASGVRPLRIIQRHVVPHLYDIVLVQMTLLFVAAIKTEVVLSFLGLDGADSISFGRMLAEAAQDLLAGQYQNFAAASVALFLLVWSTNRLGDRLQARFDPKRRYAMTKKRLELI